MPDPDLVRVRTANGFETTVSRVHAEASDDLTLLDEPATRSYGRVRPITRADGRPTKPKTTVTQAAAKKATADRPVTTEAVTASADNERNSK